MSSSFFASLLWVFICLVSLGFAQDSSAKPPDQTTHVNVNEVSLNLVVRDHRGKLVSDIKPEDLSITDGGVPVKLSALRLVSGAARAGR